MMNRALFIVFLIYVFQAAYSQDDISSHDTARLKLVFAGDIMGHDEQISGAWNPDISRYDYEPTFRYVKPYIEKADIAIGNLEVTLAGPPYKGYPQFSSPDALATAAREAGFDLFIQANNHALDRGSKGFKRTLIMLDSLKMIHTGTFSDSVDRALNYPLIMEKNGIRIALLNYTYGTNGITISKPYIINRIDTAQIRRDLHKARMASPDYTIVTIHWGDEYQRTENTTQRKLAQYMLNKGADAIIGSHPHVVQPVRVFTNNDSTQNRVVVYSQGNFVSNQRAQYKDGGILFELNLMKTAENTVMEDFSYMPAWVFRDDHTGKPAFYVVPVMLWENNTAFFSFSDHDRYKIAQFAKDTRELLNNIKENNFYKDTSVLIPHILSPL